MELQDRLQEIRTSHGQHTGRKCEVCWMLAELERQNADARVAAADAAVVAADDRVRIADKAVRWAEIERDNALADVEIWRDSSDEQALRGAKLQGELDTATYELLAARKQADGANNAHRDLGIRHLQLRSSITKALAKLAGAPQIPQVRLLAASIREALEQ